MDNIKIDLGEIGWKAVNCTGQSSIVGFYEHGVEPSGSKTWNFLMR